MTWIATASIASAVIGGIASNNAANKAASASRSAAREQAQMSREALALDRERFNHERAIYERDIRPLQERQAEIASRMGEAALEQGEAEAEFARQRRGDYNQYYRPNELRVLRETQNYDSEENISRRAGMAVANVNQQFSNAAAQRSRLLAGFGLNPNSSAFAGSTALASGRQALAAAGAGTDAAFSTMDKGLALRSDMINVGRGATSDAARAFSGSITAGQAALTGANSAMSGAIQGGNYLDGAYGALSSGLQTYAAGIGRANQMAVGAYDREANMWANVANQSALAAGQYIQGRGGWSGLFPAQQSQDWGGGANGTNDAAVAGTGSGFSWWSNNGVGAD